MNMTDEPTTDPGPDPGPDPSTTPPSDDGGTTTAAPPPHRVPRYLRRADDSPVGGVATGIAGYFDITPIVVQAAFIGLTFLNGIGILAYLAGWLLIPSLHDPETAPVTITSRTARAVVGVLALVGLGGAVLGYTTAPLEVTLLPLLAVVAGFYLLNQRDEERRAAGDDRRFRPDVPRTPPRGEPMAVTTIDTTTVADLPAPDAEVRIGSWGYAVPTTTTAAGPPTPREPRPPVTSVTLAVAAVVVGLLLAIGQFTTGFVSATVLVGAALAVVGGGLIASAFIGRARALIPIGLILALGLAAAPLADRLAEDGAGDRFETPTSEAAVDPAYRLGAGALELDLRRVDFTEDHDIRVEVGAGYAEIRVPSDVNVDVQTTSRFGYVELFGVETSGIAADDHDRVDALLTSTGEIDPDAADRPTIFIDADVTFGYVEVRRG